MTNNATSSFPTLTPLQYETIRDGARAVSMHLHKLCLSRQCKFQSVVVLNQVDGGQRIMTVVMRSVYICEIMIMLYC